MIRRALLPSTLIAFLLLPLLPLRAQSSAHPAATAGASSGATIIYRKVFKDSSPEFVEITLRDTGAGTVDIRQLDDDPDPQPLQVSAPLAAKVFEMAAGLNYFRDQHLDTRRRVANLGMKTFRFERGSEKSETSFNYTVNPTANQLTMVFEGLSLQEEHLATLQRSMRYDRLGVNKALLAFEVDLNRKVIPEPERLLPTLETLANDSRIVEIARSRARALVERIRNSRLN